MGREKIAKFIHSGLFSILVIVILGCAVYLPFAGRLGFYADDWQILTDQIANTTQVKMYSIDRPFLGYAFTFFKAFLGVTPIHWQLMIVLIRIMGAVLVYLLVKKIVRVGNPIAVVVALVAMFFPGFLRQPSSVCYLMHTIAFTGAVLSIYLSLLALNRKNVWAAVAMIGLSVLLELMYLLDGDYFIGLEVIRVILIYLCIRQERGKRRGWVRLVVKSLPYVAAAGLFLVWRVFIFHSARATTDAAVVFSAYIDNPRNALVLFGKNYYTSVLNLLFMSWVVPLYSLLLSTATKEMVVLGGSALLCSAAVVAYFVVSFRKTKKEDENNDHAKRRAGVNLVIVGILIVLITFLPIIATKRYYIFEAYFDRYSIPPLLGVAFITGGVVELLKGMKKAVYVFVGVILFLSVLTQMQNSERYANVWKVQKEFWQQMVWRVPQLQRDSVIVPVLPAGASVYDEIEAFTVANTIYYPDQDMVLKGQILTEVTAEWILKGNIMTREFRVPEYSVDYDSIVLAVMVDPESCVHVIDPGQPYFPTGVDPLVRMVAGRATLEPILTDAESHALPGAVFGAGLPRDWCYYYEKANLARQGEDWEAIVGFEREAAQQGLEAHDPSEWLPFLEAYAHLGMGSDYSRLIFKILVAEDTRFYLCYDLSRSAYYQADVVNTEIVNDICSVEHELNIP
jgi:hypothetical protein